MNTVPFPSPPEVPRLRWRVPIGAAMGFLLLASAGYCWDNHDVARASARDAIATLRQSSDPADIRNATAVALISASDIVAALRVAAQRSDAAGKSAVVALRQIHRLTEETKK